MKQIRALFSQDVSAKQTKRGQRVWFRHEAILHKSGLKIGDRVEPIYNPASKSIRLVKSENGRLSITEARGRPCFDLHNKKVEETLGEAVERVFVVLFMGEIVVRLTERAQLIWQRTKKLAKRVLNNEPFRLGETCHGAGGLAYALNMGMLKAGHGLKLAFANDFNAEAIAASTANNPVADNDTVYLNCCISEIPESIYDIEIDIYAAGLSCKGASKQARSSGKVSVPEFHDEAGWLVAPVFEHLKRFNPIVALFENVTGWLGTVSAHLLKTYAGKLGYVAHEVTMQAQDFGCIEARQRSALVLVTEGVAFEGAELDKYKGKKPPALSELLQSDAELPPVPATIDVPASQRNGWYPKARLLEREEEAKQKGRGHRAVILERGTTKLPTLVASMGKGVRLDGATIESECGLWLRNPTPVEHARAKCLPETLTFGFSNADAHMMLGNSVTVACWSALSSVIGFALVDAAGAMRDKFAHCDCCDSVNVATGLVDVSHSFWRKAVSATGKGLNEGDSHVSCRDCGHIVICDCDGSTFVLRGGVSVAA